MSWKMVIIIWAACLCVFGSGLVLPMFMQWCARNDVNFPAVLLGFVMLVPLVIKLFVKEMRE